MNVLTSLFSTAIPRPARRPQPAAPRPVRREREFGVGYGSSSGYAPARRYATAGETSRLRVV